jgi:Tfp pilus assembly protein PilP
VKYSLLFVLLILGGCAGERVKDLGGGIHSVTACSDDRISNSQVAATRAANNYCAKSGMEAVVDTFTEQDCPKSEIPTTQVVFACR